MKFNIDFDLNPTLVLFAFAIIRTVELILPPTWGALGRCIGSWAMFFIFLFGTMVIKKIASNIQKKIEEKNRW